MSRLFLFSVSVCLVSCSDTGVKAFNASPEADITSHDDGSEVSEGYIETFRGAASDPDHSAGDLTATWYLDGERVCESDTPDEDGLTTCEVMIPPTASVLTLEVQDSDHAAGSDTVTLSVLPTESPEAEISSPSTDGIYYNDQKITFSGVVSDGEDEAEALVVRWESDLDGELKVEAEPSGDGEVTRFGYLSEGEHAIELWVTDTTGKTGSDSVIVEVGPSNSSPSCAILAPETHSADEVGTTVLFEATVDDADVPADWLRVAWSSDKDGELGESTADSAGSVSFLYSDLTVESHVITLTVTDEVGATCSDYIIYSVGTPPTLSIEAPVSGDVVDEDELVSFTATVSDGEDAPTDLTLRWESDLDGEFSTQGSDSTGAISFTYSSLSIGTHSITATVTDSDGLDASALLTLQINSVPTAPVVELTPDPATTEDDLVATLTTAATDADGDPITYTYVWSVDGLASTASTTATLLAANTEKDQNWTVTVTPNDGYSDGLSGSEEVTISNTAPVLSEVLLSPDPASEDDTLVCTAGTTTDADGTLAFDYSYSWMVSGVDVSVSTDTLEGSDFDKTDEIFCTVIPSDGEDEGLAVDSNVVSVGNTVPAIDSVSISPASPSVSDPLSCSYSGFVDADGDSDSSTYSWTLGGVEVSTSDTLSIGYGASDVVTCTVTPNDGEEEGTALSDSVTILNTAPTAAEISIDPESPVEGLDDLICIIDVEATDTDGDALTYTIEWEVDGVSYTDAITTVEIGDTVPAEDTFAEEEWTCIVTPNDGTDAGPTAEFSVTIESAEVECMALELDGSTSQYVTASQSSDFDIDPSVGTTIEGWIHNPTRSSKGIAIESRGSSSSTWWSVRLAPTYLTFESEASGSSASEWRTSLDPEAEWFHFAVVSSSAFSDGAKLFINGQESTDFTSLSSGYASLVTSEEPLYFGAHSGDTTWGLDGMYYQVRFSDTARYSSDFTPDEWMTSDSDTVALWDFTEGSGSTALDLSGNGHDATIHGGSWVEGCPSQDLDEDGYTVDEDCDDDDPTAYDDNGASSLCPALSCLDIIEAGHSAGDGTYWLDPDGSGAWEAYCDMTSDDGGWTLVGVALYGDHGTSGWNDEASLNIGSATDLGAHWHLSSDRMNALAFSEEYRAVCFDSNNDYTRYWWGVSDYYWASVTSATESWDTYDRSGTSFATYWASHHYGLVSGDNETDALITSHDGHHWACGGSSGPGGEGFTGRSGNSNFRLWAR